jgi:hypothetical protein
MVGRFINYSIVMDLWATFKKAFSSLTQFPRYKALQLSSNYAQLKLIISLNYFSFPKRFQETIIKSN